VKEITIYGPNECESDQDGTDRVEEEAEDSKKRLKLLKDKRDELMKRFLVVVRENKSLREEVEEKLQLVHSRFVMARAEMNSELLEEALMFPKQKVELSASTRNIMSVDVPVLEFHSESDDEGDIYPYGFAGTTSELDGAIATLSELTPTLLKLAELEKSAQLMADEIEKTRRRVNALEYVLIPNLEETIKYIVMKLEENERGNLTRLMKVKDMMLEQAHHYSQRNA
jgi:V/A-type H+-transporting ATPase subunit D